MAKKPVKKAPKTAARPAKATRQASPPKGRNWIQALATIGSGAAAAAVRALGRSVEATNSALFASQTQAQAPKSRRSALSASAGPRRSTAAMAQRVPLSNAALQAIAKAVAKEIPQRQTGEFPTLGYLSQGRRPGLRNLPKATPFALRRFSESPPARRAIDKVKNNVLRLPWKIKPTDPKLASLLPAELPQEMQARIAKASLAFKRPNSTETFNTLTSMILEDILVGGFGCFEKRLWENPDRPFVLYEVDGYSIHINGNWTGDNPDDLDHGYRYSQVAGWGAVGQMPAGYGEQYLDSEIEYVKYTPRTNTPFGLGPLEVAFEMVNWWLGSIEARGRKESNETPEYMMSMGADASPDQVDEFRFYWRDFIEGNGETPIIGGHEDPKVLMLRPPQRGVQLNAWPDMAVRMIGLSFGLSAQSMGLEGALHNRSTADVLQSEEFADAVLPVVNILTEAYTDVVQQLLGWSDLEFEITTTHGDPQKEMEATTAFFQGDLPTWNEARERVGLEPVDESDPRGKMTASELKAYAQAQAMGNPAEQNVDNALEDPAPGAFPAGPQQQDQKSPTTAPAKERSFPNSEAGVPPRKKIEDAALHKVLDRVRTEIAGRRGDEHFSLDIDDPDLAEAIRAQVEHARVLN